MLGICYIDELHALHHLLELVGTIQAHHLTVLPAHQQRRHAERPSPSFPILFFFQEDDRYPSVSLGRQSAPPPPHTHTHTRTHTTTTTNNNPSALAVGMLRDFGQKNKIRAHCNLGTLRPHGVHPAGMAVGRVRVGRSVDLFSSYFRSIPTAECRGLARIRGRHREYLGETRRPVPSDRHRSSAVRRRRAPRYRKTTLRSVRLPRMNAGSQCQCQRPSCPFRRFFCSDSTFAARFREGVYSWTARAASSRVANLFY